LGKKGRRRRLHGSRATAAMARGGGDEPEQGKDGLGSGIGETERRKRT